MKAKQTWGHEDEKNRKNYGLQIEDKFQLEVLCSCGRKFRKANRYEYDFICKPCDIKVDLKFSPKTQKSGNIAVSANMWRKYSPDTFIVTYVSGSWFGAQKQDIPVTDAMESTHKHTGGYNGGFYASAFHLICVCNLEKI